MRVKTFWLIFLKVVGFFLVLKGVNVIIQSISTFAYVNSWENNTDGIIWISFSIVLTIVVYLFILWLFIFKTSWLIDKLHLEKGFEEDKIEINIKLSNILSIAIIVIGGIMLIESLPQLCKQIFTFYQTKVIMRENPTMGWIILYFVQGILGYLLMTNSKQITIFINKRVSADNVSDDTEQGE